MQYKLILIERDGEQYLRYQDNEHFNNYVDEKVTSLDDVINILNKLNILNNE